MRRLELGFDTKVTNRESLRAVAEDVRQIRKEAEAAEAKLKTAFSNKGTQAAGLKLFDQSVNRELADIDRQLTSIERSFASSAASASSFDTVLKGLAFGAITAGAEELARYAARTETLAVVTDQLSKVNGINVQATRQQVESVKALGITTQESMSTINRMIVANLDLRRATDLARIAQDAAIISNKNSSEALDGLILGITTRNARVLRTYGMIVDFEREYKKAAQEYGRELTNTEKVQVAFNAVLERGAQIQGSYEASMLTTGKQLGSLQRQFDEAKNSIGSGFVPVLGAAVRELSSMASWLEKNGDAISTFATTATGAWAGSRLGGLLGPWGAVGGAVVGGAAAAYLAPTEEGNILPAAQAGLQSINRRRAELERMLGRTTDRAEQERIQKQLDTIPQSVETLKAAVADAYAQVMIKASEDTPLGKNRTAVAYTRAQQKYGTGIEVSPGVTVRTVDIGQAIYDRLEPVSVSGPMVNRSAISQDQREELLRVAAEKSKKAQDKLDQTLLRFADVAVSELQKLYLDLEQTEKEISILGPRAIGKLRSVGSEAAFRLVDKQVEKDYQKKASDSLFSRDMLNYSMRLSGLNTDPGERLVLTNRGIDRAFQASPVGMEAGIGEQYAARAAGEQANITRQRERDYQLLQQMGDLEARRAELQGDQVAGLMKGYQVRMRILDIEKELGGLGKTQFDLDMERLRAREELEIRVLEIRKQQKEATKEEAGRLFDSLTANGASGITDYFSNLWRLNFRKIFSNAAGELFGGMSGKFELPGQTNKDGSLNFFGKILQGTIGGVDPAKQLETATAQNTRETALNNDLLRRMNDLLRRAQGLPAEAGGTSVGSIAGSVGALIPSGVLQGSIGAASPIFSLIDSSIRKSSVLPGWSGTSADSAVAREMAASMPAGTPVNINDNARGAAFAKGVGYATTIASGGMAVYAGIKQGGTQGYLNAASAGLATAAAVDPEPISKGVLMAAAALSSIASNVFGISEADRRKRSAEIDRTIAGARYKAPDQIEKEIDAATGGSVDTNSRGEIRVYMNVSAVDTKSFLDYKDEISQAVREGIAEGGALREEIRNIAAVA